jgi:hypothetical protein
MAVLAYWAWEWEQSPQGLVTSQAISSITAGGHHDDDADD